MLGISIHVISKQFNTLTQYKEGLKEKFKYELRLETFYMQTKIYRNVKQYVIHNLSYVEKLLHV